jgi:hypothetical protein
MGMVYAREGHWELVEKSFRNAIEGGSSWIAPSAAARIFANSPGG